MPENVQNAMFEILKRIQSDVSETKTGLEHFDERLGRVDERLGRVEERLERVELRVEQIETIVRKHRRDNAGMLVMMRATAGHFEESVSDIEAKMNTFTGRS